jgi:hypothetical protein
MVIAGVGEQDESIGVCQGRVRSAVQWGVVRSGG